MAVWGVAIFSTLATLPLLFSLQSLTLSENVTVNCLLPFITALMAWLYLGERFTKVQAVCCREFLPGSQDFVADDIVVCVAGVVMLADPFRIRGQPDADDKKDDGIPDTLSGKLFGICVVLLGMILRVPQCESSECIIQVSQILLTYSYSRSTGRRPSDYRPDIDDHLSRSRHHRSSVSVSTSSFPAPIANSRLMLITRESVVVPDRTLGWSLIGALVVSSPWDPVR